MDRVQQIAAATKNAKPTPQNPSWYHTHNDLVYVLDQLTAANKAIVAMAEVLNNYRSFPIVDRILRENAPAIEKARGG